jgi:IclR family transcriptional regulator, acetate operon repressor
VDARALTEDDFIEPASTGSATPDTLAPRIGTPTLRAFGVLEQLIASQRALSLAELAQIADQPKASLHRMLQSLEAGGLVAREPGQKNSFVIGPRLEKLGVDVMMHTGARRLRRAILERLASDLGETCNLSMLHDTQVLYLDRVESPWPLRLELKPGSHVPAHCSASGKLLLSMLPREPRMALIRAMHLERFTPHTLTDPHLLESELDRIAHKGIAVDDEEYVQGIACVAVPVCDASGRCIAAIAVHAPVSRMSLERALGFVPRLKDAASDMAATF